jgi:hypothetical protein
VASKATTLSPLTRVDLLISAAHALTMEGRGEGYLADPALAIDRCACFPVHGPTF